MIDGDELVKRLENMSPAIVSHAKAKSERIYLEQYRKSLKALLMGEAAHLKTIGEREQYAYGHIKYIEHLNALKEAVNVEEKCKWTLEHLKIQFEMWRTLQANERYQQDRV